MSGSPDIEIPQGMHIEGESPEPQESGERQLTPREITMAAIAAKRQAAMEAELAQSAVFDQDARDAGLAYPQDEPEQEPEPARSPVVREAAPVTREPEPAPAPQRPSTYSVVLDGRTFEVTDQQLQELAKLGMVANAALHEYQQQPHPVVAPEPPRPLVDPDRVRDTVRNIQFGGEDAAAAALTQLITEVAGRAAPAAPQIDQNAIVQRAVTEAERRARLAQDTAVIQQEYADIFANPQRTFLAKVNVDTIRHRNMQLGRQQSDIDVYREAGNMVRDAMGLSRPGSDGMSSSPASQSASVAPRAEVIERKRSAPRATQVIDRRAPAPEQARAPTGSELVDRMRAARGQASMR